MLGWQFKIYRQADGGASPATAQSLQGECLTIWPPAERIARLPAEQIDWLDDLVKEGKAIDLGGNGYPCRYTSAAKHLIPRIDTLTGARDKVLDDAEATRCRPDEWLLVEAWDQS